MHDFLDDQPNQTHPKAILEGEFLLSLSLSPTQAYQ
jgi:hypothetical protein